MDFTLGCFRLPLKRDVLGSNGLQRSRSDCDLLVRQRTHSASRTRARIRIAVGTYGVAIDDFYAYMPGHSYIFVPTREMWPASSVNSRLPAVPVLKKNGTPVVDKDGKPKHARPVSGSMHIGLSSR